jgi:uncharacterized protein YceK
MMKSIQSWLVLGLLTAASVLAVGCASIDGRMSSQFYPGVYPGLQHYHSAHRFDQAKRYDWSTSGSMQFLPVSENAQCLAPIDFIFSLGLDTVLLPWDVVYWAIDSAKERRAREQVLEMLEERSIEQED